MNYEQFLWPAIFGALYLLFAIVINVLSFNYIRKASKNILLPMNQADILQENILKNPVVNEKAKVLNQQYNLSAQLKSYYRNLAVTYYQNYYVFTCCSIVYSIFLSIAVFIVAGHGWQNTHLIIKVIVLMTILFAAYYYFLPNVMNNKLNLQKNMAGVKIFEEIQLDILSFLNRMDKANEEEIDTFITNIYVSIKSNYDYNINFDTSLIDKNPLDNFTGLKEK